MRLAALIPLILALTGCISATVTDLGTLGGPLSVAHDLNDDAVVVGHADNGTEVRPFIWRAGTMTPIIVPGASGSIHVAYAVNRADQVVGTVGAATVLSHAFLWRAGSATLLGSGDAESGAYDVNDEGDVAGSWTEAGARRATLWRRGVRQDLPTIAGNVSVGHGIGKHRQVVGSSTVAEGPGAPVHAVLWADGEVHDLGTLGGRSSTAEAITVGRWPDAELATTFIVGYSQTSSGASHAFVWNRGRMRDLGTLPGHVASEALDISAAGIIVGSSTDRAGNTRACMWIDGSVVDLTALLPADSGWELQSAAAINNRRQIAGHGRFRGQLRAYLLTMSW
jgi:probable HAF family extracellular repeat protein